MTPHQPFIPTREFIQNIKVGEVAPDFAGDLQEVVRIICRREDIEGKLFILYETVLGPTSTVSCSLKEGRLHRTVMLTTKYTSVQLDRMERELRMERALEQLSAQRASLQTAGSK